MAIADIKHTPAFVPDANISDVKLRRYAEARLRGGGYKSSAFQAKLPMNNPNYDAQAKKRGFL